MQGAPRVPGARWCSRVLAQSGCLAAPSAEECAEQTPEGIDLQVADPKKVTTPNNQTPTFYANSGVWSGRYELDLMDVIMIACFSLLQALSRNCCSPRIRQ